MTERTPALDAVEGEVRTLARGQATEARLVSRAAMVVAVVYDGVGIVRAARQHGVVRHTVSSWVKRFLANPGVDALQDAERSGRPPTYGDRDHAIVLTLACQRPEDVGRLEGRMTQAIIAEEAAKRGVPVSRSTVQRTMATAEVRPHKERYYLFTDKSDPQYVPRRDAICDLYTQDLPPDEVVVCFDEQTGLQALGLRRGLPHGGRRSAAHGQDPLLEHQYVRHGSRSLSAVVRPDTGELVCAEVFPSRGYDTTCAISMLETVLDVLPADRYRKVHVVMDNGPTHRSNAPALTRMGPPLLTRKGPPAEGGCAVAVGAGAPPAGARSSGEDGPGRRRGRDRGHPWSGGRAGAQRGGPGWIATPAGSWGHIKQALT